MTLFLSRGAGISRVSILSVTAGNAQTVFDFSSEAVIAKIYSWPVLDIERTSGFNERLPIVSRRGFGIAGNGWELAVYRVFEHGGYRVA